jgi:hypothetical protein
MTNEDIVRRYCTAVSTRDHDTAESLRHRDWQCDWPQSGERVTSSPAMRAIIDAYPDGPWEAKERRLRGSEDQYVVTPSGTLVAVAGAGDTWTAEWSNLYPHDREYLVVDIIQLRDGRVYRETTYWAEPFPAPAWRREWVELDEPAERAEPGAPA